jgi:hypothetical protein
MAFMCSALSFTDEYIVGITYFAIFKILYIFDEFTHITIDFGAGAALCAAWALFIVSKADLIMSSSLCSSL